jgi:anti-sigma-K factor RskA
VAEDHFEGLLISYLLGELSVEDELELEHHLEECPECRHELDQVRRSHDLLRHLATYEPPTELEDRMLAHVRGEMPARSSGGWRLWVSAAALVVVALLGIGILRAILGDSTTGVPLTSTAVAPEAGGQVQVEQEGENFQVELEVWKMPELEQDEYYEMWYYAEDGDRISCGAFRTGPEGRTTVNLTAPATARDYPEIEITREPDDGNPEASGEEVLEGKLPST